MLSWLDIIRSPLTSVIDILLVATFVYYILLPLKGTRSARIAIGISFLILLYFIADRFELQTMSWLLRYFLAYIAFAIIVIFQADIRKALATFGRNPFLDFFQIQAQSTGYLPEVQKAVNLLAQRNIGALIVIERELELKNLIESGLVIDAQIKSELLLSIFNTRSPMHDGAVILAGGRLASAGTILPLSSKLIDKEFGTRHRAALGLSEEYDAIVIVVSEEQGSVCLARDGELEKLKSALELESKLKALLELK